MLCAESVLSQWMQRTSAHYEACNHFHCPRRYLARMHADGHRPPHLRKSPHDQNENRLPVVNKLGVKSSMREGRKEPYDIMQRIEQARHFACVAGQWPMDTALVPGCAFNMLSMMTSTHFTRSGPKAYLQRFSIHRVMTDGASSIFSAVILL